MIYAVTVKNIDDEVNTVKNIDDETCTCKL